MSAFVNFPASVASVNLCLPPKKKLLACRDCGDYINFQNKIYSPALSEYFGIDL